MSEPTEFELVVSADGGVKCIYDEAVDLRALGKLQITRASRVEPDAKGCGRPTWHQVGQFGKRAQAWAA
jgi:hypothetical protein